MTCSICMGKILTPFQMNMSSSLPEIREILRWVLPQGQGSDISEARSRVLYRIKGMASLVRVVKTFSPTSPSGMDNALVVAGLVVERLI